MSYITSSETVTVRTDFRIRNLDGVERKVVSDKFYSSDWPENKWRLIVYPNGCLSRGKEYLSIYLTVESTILEPIEVDYVLAVRQNDVNIATKFVMSKFEPGQRRGFGKFIRRDLLQTVLQNIDHFDIHCSITHKRRGTNNLGVASDMIPLFNLREDLKNCKNSSSANIELAAGKTTYRVHSFVLEARSKVFKSMLETQMREKATNRISIGDFDGKLLEKLVDYLYTAHINFANIEESLEFIQLADQYELADLFQMAEKYICCHINSNNLVVSLIIGDLHSSNQIVDHCIKQLSQHALELPKLPNWHFLYKHPLLMDRILLTINGTLFSSS